MFDTVTILWKIEDDRHCINDVLENIVYVMPIIFNWVGTEARDCLLGFAWLLKRLKNGVHQMDSEIGWKSFNGECG